MWTNFGVKGIIGYWDVGGKKVECLSLYSNPNNFDDELSVRYADDSKSAWARVESEGKRQFIVFDGNTLYMDDIKGENDYA